VDNIKVFSCDIIMSRYCASISHPISEKNLDIGAVKTVEIEVFFFDIEDKNFEIKSGKDGWIGLSSISYP
jgi:hypothetical protein